MSILTPEQIRQFDDNGFVLVSGLIPEEVAARAEATMWAAMDANPDDPATWEGKQWASGHSHPDILALFTPEVARAADMLSNEAKPGWQPPTGSLALNVFPQSGEWRHHGPHIDHALKKDNFKVFPRPMRLASLLYLNDVDPDSGNTVVWPGSHKKIAELAKSDPEKYKLMWTLNNDLATLDLGEPVQVGGKRGDVLFYHYLCAHSGSLNVGTRPRLALAHKW
jgi:hypothetical protein